jgi:biopolymer transport protein ExbB
MLQTDNLKIKAYVASAAFLIAFPVALQASESGQPSVSTLDLWEVFYSCPLIYSILLFLSLAATGIWIYTILTLRHNDLLPKKFLADVRALLMEGHYDRALEACKQESSITASIIGSGIEARPQGCQIVMDTMQLEGKRKGNILWQRIALLNEVAAVAPMIGLLGTVLGLFFAFYDVNRSAESIASIFDGLGIAIGTTVAGLVVAILAMIYYTTLKYRVINLLNDVENESFALAVLINRNDIRNSPNY